MAGINYAEQYARALAQSYPYVLNFGALYATENNGRYRMGEDGKTIYIPNISTTGRVAADRDTIATATRNYDNAWEPKTLSNQRKWSTLVHPKDIDQTNEVASIQNITRVFNEEQKFPEMDAYLISTLYKLWSSTDPKDSSKQAMTADATALAKENVLTVFDKLMLNMDNARVPANGRILYCTYEVQTMLKEAAGITRNFDVQQGGGAINRSVSRPNAVITPVSYQFAQLDPPTAVTEGKYIYYEESFEDVFILNRKQDALQFNVSDTIPSA